jgi:hypothetical protein
MTVWLIQIVLIIFRCNIRSFLVIFYKLISKVKGFLIKDSNTYVIYSLFPPLSEYCVTIYVYKIMYSKFRAMYLHWHIHIAIHSMPLLMAFVLRSIGVLYQLDANNGKAMRSISNTSQFHIQLNSCLLDISN